MKKALRKILVLAVCICVFVSSISVSATTTAGYTPYPKIEYSYSSSVSVGTIRYISQISSSSYFYSSYWGGWVSNAYEECGTASISMALSYVGINKTPKNILDKGNGLTYFDGWGVEMQRPSVANGMTNYINGNGKYSPPIVHFTTGYTSGTHYVILIGKVSSSSYLVLDPASNSTWTLSTSDAKYKSIDRVIQYYNPDVSIQQPITETPEIRTDKEVYSPGENVIFIRNEVENTNFYQLIVYYMGGNGEVNEQIYSESMDDVTQKLSFDDDGKYCVYIQAGNAVNGTITSAPYYFYVGNVITETPEISTDKTVYSPGEDVMFIRNEVENTNFYQHIIYYMGINGELNDQIYSESMDNTTCLMSFNDVGKYCVYIQVGNAVSGTITSAPYYFYVENEITERPIIDSDQVNYKDTSEIVFTRNDVANATEYTLFIWTTDEENEQKLVLQIKMPENQYILTGLEAGKYFAELNACNSFYNTWSTPVEFNVWAPMTQAPILATDKENYTFGEDVKLTWTVLKDANSMNISFLKYNSESNYYNWIFELYFDYDEMSEKEYVLQNLEPGLYAAKITAWNPAGDKVAGEYIFFNIDPAHTHSYTKSVIEPSCTTVGKRTYTCDCGDSYSVTIPKSDHVFSAKYTTDIQATYFNEGRASRHCLNCTASTDHIIIDRLTPAASLLVNLRKSLLNERFNAEYDYNGDKQVDIRDLVKLKKSYCGIF